MKRALDVVDILSLIRNDLDEDADMDIQVVAPGRAVHRTAA